MTRVLSVLVHKRPAYLARTLAALSRCEGIADYEVLFHAHTPVDGLVASLVRGWDASPSRFYASPLAGGEDRQDRVALATFGALDIAFRSAPFVVHLEDDVLLAPDALRWFETMERRFVGDTEYVFGLSAYSECDVDLGTNVGVHFHDSMVPLAFATWRDRWEPWSAAWNGRRPQQPWDDYAQVIRGGRYVVQPGGISLAQHIGHEGGAPTTAHTETPLWVAA